MWASAGLHMMQGLWGGNPEQQMQLQHTAFQRAVSCSPLSTCRVIWVWTLLHTSISVLLYQVKTPKQYRQTISFPEMYFFQTSRPHSSPTGTILPAASQWWGTIASGPNTKLLKRKDIWMPKQLIKGWPSPEEEELVVREVERGPKGGTEPSCHSANKTRYNISWDKVP